MGIGEGRGTAAALFFAKIRDVALAAGIGVITKHKPEIKRNNTIRYIRVHKQQVFKFFSEKKLNMSSLL